MSSPLKMTIFHFNCSLCGAHPLEEDLLGFLTHWKTAPRKQIDALLNKASTALQILLAKNKMIKVKKIRSSFENEVALLKQLSRTSEKSGELLRRNEQQRVICLFDCPLCSSAAGERPRDNYFTVWDAACCVQTSNLLYELGILLFAIASSLPSWATSTDLKLFGQVLKSNRKSQESIGFLECPFCRRFTNGLYGEGTASNPHRCRWCLDSAGGGQIVLCLRSKEKFEEGIRLYLETQSPSDKAMMEHFLTQNLDCFVPQGVPESPLPDTIIPKPKKKR